MLRRLYNQTLNDMEYLSYEKGLNIHQNTSCFFCVFKHKHKSLLVCSRNLEKKTAMIFLAENKWEMKSNDPLQWIQNKWTINFAFYLV